MCKSAILFSKDDFNLGERLKFVCREKRANLSYCRTFPELLFLNSQSMPELIFFDDESIPFNYKLFLDFKQSKLYHIPCIVIVSTCPEKFTFNDESIIVVNKQNYINQFDKIFNKIGEKKSKLLSETQKNTIKKDVSTFLNKLGLTTNYLGYSYIKELVVKVVEDRRKLKSFNSKLYPELAMQYNTPVINIERNIRNAINVAIKSCKDKEIYDKITTGLHLSNVHRVPSNKQFITWLVEKVAL